MPGMSEFWLRVAAALYACGLVHAIATAVRREPVMFRFSLSAFTVGALLHMVSLVELWVKLGHLPTDNFFQSMSVCAFQIAIFFLFVHWRYQFAPLAVFLFPLVFVMTLLAAMETPVPTWSNQSVRGAWLLAHVMLVMAGYAALLVTALASVFYLVEERRLKAKRPATLFSRLPPLGTLDNLINKGMGIGFALLTLATVAGATWAFVESGTRWIADGKIAISLFTWALCLLMIFLRMSAGWRGRKAALLSLTILGSSALTWAAHAGLRLTLAR